MAESHPEWDACRVQTCEERNGVLASLSRKYFKVLLEMQRHESPSQERHDHE